MDETTTAKVRFAIDKLSTVAEALELLAGSSTIAEPTRVYAETYASQLRRAVASLTEVITGEPHEGN